MEKLELIGIDYLWKIIMEVPNEEIAMLAVRLLMRMSYTWLSHKLKKVCNIRNRNRLYVYMLVDNWIQSS